MASGHDLAMAEVADVLALRLQSQGLGTVGTDIFVDWMPDKTDSLIAVYRVAGPGATYVMNAAPTVTQSRMQVYTRGAPLDYQTPRSTAKDVAKQFHPLVHIVLSGMRILAMSATDDPHLVERDSKERCVFAQFWDVTHEDELT